MFVICVESVACNTVLIFLRFVLQSVAGKVLLDVIQVLQIGYTVKSRILINSLWIIKPASAERLQAVSRQGWSIRS